MKDVFPLNKNSFYKTSKKRTLGSRHIITAHFGFETLSHLALKIWDLLPEWVKNLEPVASFQNAIEKWKPANCACYLWRIYIFQVGFVSLLYNAK